MVRKLVRAMLWGVKCVLAMVALGALFLWPWSYERPGLVVGRRMKVGSGWVDARYLYAGCDQGQVGIGTTAWGYPRASLTFALATSADPGWTWHLDGSETWTAFTRQTSPWGPFRWHAGATAQDGETLAFHALVLPCGLLALTAGAWPLASAALLVRRRRRARRLRLTGCCRHCGYDLRATPSPRGARLPTCPECGAAADAA